jgi:hypothetical protein
MAARPLDALHGRVIDLEAPIDAAVSLFRQDKRKESFLFLQRGRSKLRADAAYVPTSPKVSAVPRTRTSDGH